MSNQIKSVKSNKFKIVQYNLIRSPWQTFVVLQNCLFGKVVGNVLECWSLEAFVVLAHINANPIYPNQETYQSMQVNDVGTESCSSCMYSHIAILTNIS
jgi:hypothetical protein